jgi:hypothetical protein
MSQAIYESRTRKSAQCRRGCGIFFLGPVHECLRYELKMDKGAPAIRLLGTLPLISADPDSYGENGYRSELKRPAIPARPLLRADSVQANPASDD